jgi:hypothetical protein
MVLDCSYELLEDPAISEYQHSSGWREPLRLTLGASWVFINLKCDISERKGDFGGGIAHGGRGQGKLRIVRVVRRKSRSSPPRRLPFPPTTTQLNPARTSSGVHLKTTSTALGLDQVDNAGAFNISAERRPTLDVHKRGSIVCSHKMPAIGMN